MDVAPRLSQLAGLLADPTRATILTALLDGRALTASELAHLANASPQSISGHLNKLLAGELVEVTSSGRHRYFRLSSPEVAHAVEAMSALAGGGNTKAATKAPPALWFARCCYDHLAGRLGVLLADTLQTRGLLTLEAKDFTLTAAGQSWFTNFGIDAGALQHQRRQFARACLDWTERRPHLAGALGAALLANLLQRGWLEPAKTRRALRLTPVGAAGLKAVLGLGLTELG